MSQMVCVCVFFVARLNPRYFFLCKARSFRNGAASWASAKEFFDSQIRSLLTVGLHAFLCTHFSFNFFTSREGWLGKSCCSY